MRKPPLTLRPSASPRWAGGCPGSASLEAQYVTPDTPSAREGTAAHFYATERLQGRVHPAGMLTPNGVPIDQDMIDGGDLLYRTVTAIAGEPAVETLHTMHGLIHPAVEGTPDVVIVDLAAHRLWVIDYKYGHRYVEIYRNLQLLCYAAGAWERLELTRDDVKGWEVTLCIVQPRCYSAQSVRTWQTLGHVVWEAIAEIAVQAELAAGPNPPTHTGDYCRDCDARHACDALRKAGGLAMDVASDASPQGMTTTEAAVELRWLTLAAERLEARRTGLQETIRAAIQAGASVPYWSLERSRGLERWTRPAAEVIAMGDMMGVDIRKPQAPLTPRQAREAGLDETVIAGYSDRIPGEAKLVMVGQTDVARRFDV